MGVRRTGAWLAMGGVVVALGCAGSRAEVRGAAPSGTPVPVSALRGAQAKQVMVQGSMIEK